jgi:hypothetical protein
MGVDGDLWVCPSPPWAFCSFYIAVFFFFTLLYFSFNSRPIMFLAHYCFCEPTAFLWEGENDTSGFDFISLFCAEPSFLAIHTKNIREKSFPYRVWDKGMKNGGGGKNTGGGVFLLI